MKKLLLSFVILTSVFQLFSQNTNVFQSLKYGIYSEYFLPPAYVSGFDETRNSSGQDTTVYFFDRSIRGNIMNVVYNFRYSILEVNDNMTLGVNIAPSIGTGGIQGIGSLNIPVTLSWDFGAGSTYNTGASAGGFMSIGGELNKVNLIPIDEIVLPSNSPYEKPKTLWFGMAYTAGVRWWNKANRLKELSLKIGTSSATNLPDEVFTDLKPELSIKNYTIQLTFGQFLNY